MPPNYVSTGHAPGTNEAAKVLDRGQALRHLCAARCHDLGPGGGGDPQFQSACCPDQGIQIGLPRRREGRTRRRSDLRGGDEITRHLHVAGQMAKPFAKGLTRFNDQIGDVMEEWKKSVLPGDARPLPNLPRACRNYRNFAANWWPRHRNQPGFRSRMG